ncbi:MAG: hypothetical protein HeimC3_34030 [Candidatus Heimdallarchaeota archaeon LC_3]|nr:MAG: hypothetical protein HeimC3_34030 [Candidatus Heimdallarchaeota archaeon LC_3]
MAENFTELELMILRIIAELNHWGLHAHYSTDTGIKKLLLKEINPSNIIYKKWKKKGLAHLLSAKLVIEHKTSGNITYQLTKEGLIIAKEILDFL